MIKIKNVRPGVLILSDAKLKLPPGGTADVETLSVQMQQCLDNGLLIQVTTETEVKPKAKSTTKKTATQTAATEQSQPVEASTDTKASTADGGQGQLIEAPDDNS
ncbi:MAG: hypothetical protein ABFD49_07065 [Armatimonadota bacterium]|nr:hypothetical protein [bacterium]